MSFLDKLRKDKIQAMKDKDKVRKNVITNLMSPIALAEKEKGSELSDGEAMKYVQKELKQAEDTLDSLPEDRTENIEEAKERIAIISSYLPKALTDEEILEEIKKIMEEKNLEKSPKSLGPIIGEMTSKFPGRVEGSQISKLAQKIFNK